MQSGLFRRSQALARAAGIFAIACGVAVLTGWTFDIGILKTVLPDSAPMTPLATLGFIAIGTSLLLTGLAPNRAATPPAQALCAQAGALIFAGVGLITLIEILSGVRLGIDTLLFPRAIAAAGTLYPGRMSFTTASCFVLSGLAIACLHSRSPLLRQSSQALALGALIVAFVVVLGYLYGLPRLVRPSSQDPIAVHSAITFVIVGIGTVLARPGAGFMATVLSALDGGVMARRMLPLSILLPVLLGWLRLAGQRAGWWGAETGLAIFVASGVIAFSTVVVLAALSLNRSDSQRRKAEALSLGQKHVLEMIARGAPLHETLETLVRHVEEQIPEMCCSILLLDPETRQLRHGAAPRLPRQYIEAIDGSMIGAQAGSCGTAAFRGEPVFVEDIATDPLWTDYKHLALEHGLRACWSTPILDADGRVLGTFAIYYSRPALPQKEHLRVVDAATHTAAICISRHRVEKGLRESESRFRQLTESLPQLVWTCEPAGPCDYLGRQWVEYTGIPAERQLGFRWIDQIHPADREPTLAAWKAAVAGDADLHIEHRIRRHDGVYRWFDTRAVRLLDQEGRIVKWFGSNTDITERKTTEDVRIRSQKIEAMGTLAGGIAHDFNNILLAIDGHTKILNDELAPHHPARESITGIGKATARAADLVRRILAFSRQQDSKPEALRLRPVIEEALKLVRATIPAMIEIRVDLPQDTPPVSIDATQVHQIIINLATNAAYSIGPKGGVIDLRLDALTVDNDLANAIRDLRPGRHVRLVMADNGHGMDRATMSRIFDPFFTTKPAGQGTGLGLSIVHGIMKSCRGIVTVYSQPDKGTSFHLYFPVAENKIESRTTQPPTAETARGEHVMYVDDEEPLVRLALRVLTRLGYKVTGHLDPAEALEDFRQRPNEFDVVITDVSMPSMSGFDLTRALLAIRPELPVLMTSGYMKHEDEEAALRMGVREIILKPNTLDELGKALNRLFKREEIAKAENAT